MSKYNKVNPGNVQFAGRLTPDEAAHKDTSSSATSARRQDTTPAAKARVRMPAGAPVMRDKNAAQAPARVEAKDKEHAADGRWRG